MPSILEMKNTCHCREKHSHEAPCEYQATIDALRETLNRSLCGKTNVIEYVLACLLARGHLLLEDLPGLGKTTLAKALAHAVGGDFARMQCTPDLLPNDITGFNIFNQQSRDFEFVEGPVFADVLLADEINRATPRTQSALFEAMAERQVTVDNHCRKLPETFFVIATQNPVESHGTYPLPEAQLDRFALKLSIGYPNRASEVEMLQAGVGSLSAKTESPEPVVRLAELQHLQEHVAQVAVDATVQDYLVSLATATRNHPEIALGLSPRGLLIWQRVAQAWAHLHRRGFVTPDDIQEVAQPVLAVRLAGRFESASQLIEELIQSVPVPAGITPQVK
jgi:MoxR-like ATPase